MSKLSDAQIRLVFKKDSAFFASLMYQVTWEYNNIIPTAGINNTKCVVNPSWFDSLTDDEQVGLLAHEIMHLVLMHQPRQGERDPAIWNMAGDYLINYLLTQQGFTLPPEGLYDSKLNDAYTTEEIYEILMDDQDKDQPQFPQQNTIPDLGQGDGDSGDGLGDDSDGSSEAQKQALEHKIAQMVTTAVTQAKMSGSSAGNIPNGVELLLDSVLYPKVPWHVHLFQYFCEISRDDFSTQRRNRRYRGVVVPALHSESMGKISTYLDISCSVTDEQFAKQHSEMGHIKNTLNPSTMEIIEFDTEIKKVRTFSSEESIANLVFTGRGGTCLRDVGKRIAKSDAEVSVIFTDGYVNLEPVTKLTNKQIIWVIIDNPNFTAKHGKIIYLD